MDMNETDQTDEVEHVVIFSGRNYKRVYIPSFLKFHKSELMHYKFIKTIDAGSSMGHIIQGGNEYYMCLSQDDNIRVEQLTMEPMGFRRSSITQLESLADVFNVAMQSEVERTYNSTSRGHPKVVIPPDLNMSLDWCQRMNNHYIINVINQQEVHMAAVKGDIAAQCGLSIHLLNGIIRDGIQAKNWCYKGRRIDGFSWPEYFNSLQSANPISAQTP